MKKFSFIFTLLASALLAFSQEHRWWHIYYNDYDFTSLMAPNVQTVQYPECEDGILSITCSDNTALEIPLGRIDKLVFGTNVPTLYITLPDNPELTELREKETYLDALLTIQGEGICDDADGLVCTIKGRGNSTWKYDKKPYRLKFAKKTAILGFEKQKSYVLIANYIDCTLMRNAIAFKLAQMLDMPYTNHVQPIRVYLNGIFKGAYFISEKIGISGASVDIADEEGILWELDTNYDEDYKFYSTYYNMPVMVHDPDFDEVATTLGCTADDLFQKWKQDFLDFEKKVYTGQAADGDDFDLESLAKYALVYNFCGNRELNWPKSTYIYKPTIQAPYYFGPVWDFDWAFTYDNGYETKSPDQPLLQQWSPLKGDPFFRKLFKRNDFQTRYAELWERFTKDLWPQLIEYIDEYAAEIEPSAIENGVLWPAYTGRTAGTFDFCANVAILKQWLEDRIAYISSADNFGLY